MIKGREQVDEKAKTITLDQPSIFKGEIPFLTFTVGGKKIGKLWATGGVLSFEGDCEKSAELFFEEIIEKNKHLLCEKGNE